MTPTSITNPARISKVAWLVALALAPAAASAQGLQGHSKTWSWEQGDAKTISAYINGKLELTGKKDYLKAGAYGRAGAKLFGKSIDVLKVDATAEVNSGKLNVNASLNVGGYSVFKFAESKNVKYEKSGKQSKSLDASTKMPVTVIAIPMTVTLGVRGEAGIKYGFGLTPISAKAYVTPFIKATAYAQVAIELLVARGGAGADLTIIDNNLDLSAEAYIAPSASKKLVLYTRLSGINTLNMLNGRVYVFGEIGAFGWTKRGELELFKWNGIRVRGTLFDVKKDFPLL